MTLLTALVQNGQYNAFPGLVRTQTNRRVLLYRKATDHVGSKGVIVCRIAEGLGGAYSAETTIFSDATYDARDPEIAEIDITGGKRLIVSCFLYESPTLLNGVRVFWSDDNGDTWSAAVTCTSTFSVGSACSAKIVQLANGDLLLPCYGKDAGLNLLEIQKSTDDGATWTASQPFGAAVDGGLVEPNILLLANGDLLMLVRTSGNNLYESVSTDSGVTWSALAYKMPYYAKPHMTLLPDGRVSLITRNVRSVVVYRTNGVWGTRQNLHGSLPYLMMYASSFIDENGNWEIVVGMESADGLDSDLFGMTKQLAQGHLAMQFGGSVLLIAAKD